MSHPLDSLAKTFICVGALAVIVTFVGCASNGITRSTQALEVISHQLQRPEDGGLVCVIGTVTNHSDQQYFRLNVEFELTDRDGKSSGTTTDYVGNLAAHKTWDFKAIVLEGNTAQARLVKLQGEPESKLYLRKRKLR